MPRQRAVQVVGVQREERERPVDDERDAEGVAELAQDLDRDDERREGLPRVDCCVKKHSRRSTPASAQGIPRGGATVKWKTSNRASSATSG